MRFTVLSFWFVGVICATALAELRVEVYINGTVKCEAHKKCETLMAAFTSWLPKGEIVPQTWAQNYLDYHAATMDVRWEDGLNEGDSYYLRIDHSCPCSNVTSGDACKTTMNMDPRRSLCIDLEDKLKALRPKGHPCKFRPEAICVDSRLVFDLGEVDLSAPWKYSTCAPPESYAPPCPP